MFENDVKYFEPYNDELNLTDDEIKIYVEQVKVGCTKAMLQCLDDADRFIYILGKLFEFSSKDGAEICGLTETAYRKRLSRAVNKIKNFMNLNCGLINPNVICRCSKRIAYSA